MMESLALTHSFQSYEEPAPVIKSFDQLGLKISNSAWVGLAAIALIFSAITVPTEAQAALRRVSTNGSNLNIRSGPGLGYCVIGKLRNGSLIRTTRYRHGWAKLRHGGWISTAWVSNNRRARSLAYHHKASCYRRCVY